MHANKNWVISVRRWESIQASQVKFKSSSELYHTSLEGYMVLFHGLAAVFIPVNAC